MELVKNVQVLIYGKVPITVDVERYSRGGTKSPILDIIIYKGKRYPPILQRILDIRWTFNSLFKLTYGPSIDKLIFNDNPFLSCIPKDKHWANLYHQPVVIPFGKV